MSAAAHNHGIDLLLKQADADEESRHGVLVASGVPEDEASAEVARYRKRLWIREQRLSATSTVDATDEQRIEADEQRYALAMIEPHDSDGENVAHNGSTPFSTLAVVGQMFDQMIDIGSNERMTPSSSTRRSIKTVLRCTRMCAMR